MSKNLLHIYKNTCMYTQIFKNEEYLTENNQMLKVLKMTPIETGDCGFKKQVPKIFILKI